jgi:hypothetical protein
VQVLQEQVSKPVHEFLEHVKQLAQVSKPVHEFLEHVKQLAQVMKVRVMRQMQV